MPIPKIKKDQVNKPTSFLRKLEHEQMKSNVSRKRTE